MKLQMKSILAFNIMLALACVIVGLLGYFTADHGFGFALEQKAVHDLEEINAVLEARYPGPWESRPDGLYKGGKKFNDDNALLDELGQLSGNNVTMFNKDTRIATTFQDSAGKRPVGTKASAAIITTVLQEGKSFSGYAEVLGNRYLSAYKPLKNQSGQVVGMLFMGIPTKDLDEIQSGFIRTIVIAIILLLVVIGAISWLVIGKIVKQIEGVVDHMGEMSHGNLRLEPLPVTSNDEIGQMSDAFNAMLKNIRGLITQVSNSAEQVAASSEELTASSQQAAEAATHVAQTIIEISGGMEKQLTSVDSAKQNIDTAFIDINAMTEKAAVVSENTEQMAGAADHGAELMNNAMEKMNGIEQSVANSAQVVKKLGENSKQIGQIVESISAIADQTNLLALNAAIEAARAGEAGRGFSVVAEEVRKLAEQSQDSAQHISTLIASIQSDTSQAVDAMARGTAKVKEGSASVDSLGSAFESIHSVVEGLSREATASLSTFEALEQKIGGIASSAQDVANSAKLVNDEAQSASASVQEQSAGMQEIASASSSLATLANGLNSAVGQFKV
ncbi:MAG: methyl-accepting chemotaxis protein [Schwartzia sp.]|nr:methyl-accepting chemotaxis protein [Schwartzia sp. (in: firmicutes)]